MLTRLNASQGVQEDTFLLFAANWWFCGSERLMQPNIFGAANGLWLWKCYFQWHCHHQRSKICWPCSRLPVFSRLLETLVNVFFWSLVRSHFFSSMVSMYIQTLIHPTPAHPDSIPKKTCYYSRETNAQEHVTPRFAVAKTRVYATTEPITNLYKSDTWKFVTGHQLGNGKASPSAPNSLRSHGTIHGSTMVKEHLQENCTFHGKLDGFLWFCFFPKPIHWIVVPIYVIIFS